MIGASLQTPSDPDPSDQAVSHGEERQVPGNVARCPLEPVRESTVKPVGKPDAGNRHVRFDERGWETGRRLASVLAPILDSTRIHSCRFRGAGFSPPRRLSSRRMPRDSLRQHVSA